MHKKLLPYACKEEGCGKKFAQLHDLKRHVMTHTGEQPFACSVCSQGFNRNGSAQKHIKGLHKADETARVIYNPGNKGKDSDEKFGLEELASADPGSDKFNAALGAGAGTSMRLRPRTQKVRPDSYGLSDSDNDE